MQYRSGRCLCGAVHYVLTGEPRAITVCHCTHCRRQSGSPFSLNVVIRDTEYEQSGDTTVYVDTGDSGNPVYRHFCGRCGSPVFATTGLLPRKIIVKAGTLDSIQGLKPGEEIYTDHAMGWVVPIEGARQFTQGL